MPGWIVPPSAGMIEPTVAPEFFIDSLGAIELTGDHIRVFFCSEQMPFEAQEKEPHRIVTVKLVRPIATIPDAIARLALCLQPAIIKPRRGPWPRAVE